MTHPFEPDWTIAPSVMLTHWMEENNISARVLAAAGRCPARFEPGMTREQQKCAVADARAQTLALIDDVLARRPLTEEHARCLERGTQIPVRFWLTFEHNYRAGLAAGLTDASE